MSIFSKLFEGKKDVVDTTAPTNEATAPVAEVTPEEAAPIMETGATPAEAPEAPTEEATKVEESEQIGYGNEEKPVA